MTLRGVRRWAARRTDNVVGEPLLCLPIRTAGRPCSAHPYAPQTPALLTIDRPSTAPAGPHRHPAGAVFVEVFSGSNVEI